jgi:predicted N-acetyltransferase YhbS
MSMNVNLRDMRPEDVETCGQICFEAFKGIAEKHNFPYDLPKVEDGIQLTQAFCSSPQIYSIVAESEGKIIGSNHLWEYDEVRAVGPITVDPTVQAKGTGRILMQAVIDRGKGAKSIRLVQDAFNGASMSLYTSLGFDVKEPLVLIGGIIKGEVPSGFEVRPIQESDFEICKDLCRSTIGFDRNNEFRATPPFLQSFVAVRDGKIRAYASAPHFWALNHAVAETVEDMQAVLTGASVLGNYAPLSLLLPIRQAELFRWLLHRGMRVVKPATLMSMGEYDDPKQVYLPSVGY